MAKRISTLPRTFRGAKYPWDEWMDGSVWVTEHGIDFQISAETFRALIHSAANQRGLKAQTRIRGGEVFFTAS